MLFRRDILHKHHKQYLCKIISSVGKISYGEKIFVLLLVELTMLCKDNAILGEIGHFQLLQHCALVVSGIDGTVAHGLWNVEDLIFLC